MRVSLATAISSRRPRALVSMLVVFALASAFFALQIQVAGADAGNPILGTINVSNHDNGDGTVTVYVRGEWNWLSHNSDCNFDRAGTGVGIIWNDPTEPGYPIQIQGANGTLTNGSKTVTSFVGTKTPSIGNRVTGTGIPAGTYLTAVSGSSGNWTLTLSNAATITGTKKLTLSADVGVSSIRAGDTYNTVDRMVHPVDVGNAPQSYTSGTYQSTTQGYPTNAPGDYPSGQEFNDPSPSTLSTTAVANWKAGCGREPLTDTSNGNTTPSNAAGCGESPPSTDCSGHPWGSWGYDKNLPADGDNKAGGGRGYSHTYEKTGLPSQICANFYDVHGGGKFGNTSFQVPGSAGNITVDGNGDNSIQTNAFNVNNGANCVKVDLPAIKVTKTPHSQQIPPGATATWTIHVENTGNVTLTNVHVDDQSGVASCTKSATQIAGLPAHAPPHNPSGSTFAPGDYVEYSCSEPNVTSGFTNVVEACGTFAATNDTCDNSSATLDQRSGGIVVASTEQNFVPNDSATLSGDTDPAKSLNGNLRFKLYKGTGCTDATKLLFDSGDIAVSGNGTTGSGNTDDLKTLLVNATPALPDATAGTYSWLVKYSGDTHGNTDITFACGAEKFVITNT